MPPAFRHAPAPVVTAQIQYSLANARWYFSVTEELCTRFSKRHAHIDEAYRKLLQDNPALAQVDAQDLRRFVETAERSQKHQDVTPSRLRALWDAQQSSYQCPAVVRLHFPWASGHPDLHPERWGTP